jgi:hypothetical protein
LVAAQQRHLLAAERSTEMPQEYQDQCPVFPELLQIDTGTIRKRYANIGTSGVSLLMSEPSFYEAVEKNPF